MIMHLFGDATQKPQSRCSLLPPPCPCLGSTMDGPPSRHIGPKPGTNPKSNPFVHDFRVSFSIRERNPQIVVSVSVFQVLWSKKRKIDSDNFYVTVLSPLYHFVHGRRTPTGSSEGHRRGRVRPSDPFAPARSGLSLSAAIFRSGALLVDSRVRVGHLERLNGAYGHPNSVRISETCSTPPCSSLRPPSCVNIPSRPLRTKTQDPPLDYLET